MSHSRASTIHPSARKIRAGQALQRLAVAVSDGAEYGLEDAVLPHATLADARRALQDVPDSLAKAVIEERQSS